MPCFVSCVFFSQMLSGVRGFFTFFFIYLGLLLLHLFPPSYEIYNLPIYLSLREMTYLMQVYRRNAKASWLPTHAEILINECSGDSRSISLISVCTGSLGVTMLIFLAEVCCSSVMFRAYSYFMRARANEFRSAACMNVGVRSRALSFRWAVMLRRYEVMILEAPKWCRRASSPCRRQNDCRKKRPV